MQEQEPNSFPELLKHYMSEKRWTIPRLSHEADVSKRTIDNWREGIVKKPGVLHVLKVAKTMELSIEEANRLLKSAHHASIQELYEKAELKEAQVLLEHWYPFENSPGNKLVASHSFPMVATTDWGDSRDISCFIGRQHEQDQLRTWIVSDRCRVVGIFGPGGMGKSMLAKKVATGLRYEFDYVFWRSLVDKLLPEDMLRELVQFVSEHTEFQIQHNYQVLEYLREHRCLIILDNVETILKSGDDFGECITQYEKYDAFIKFFGETEHRSCLILTSREEPKVFSSLQWEHATSSYVREHRLAEVSLEDTQRILEKSQLQAEEAEWLELIRCCSGIPKILEIVAAHVEQIYGGSVALFLKKQKVTFHDVKDLMKQQFERMSQAEQAIMYWLAIERIAVSVEHLESVVAPDPNEWVREALHTLQRRMMIERDEVSGKLPTFYLQHAIKEFVTDVFVEHICEEFQTEEFDLFRHHALVKADSDYYVRESQMQLVLEPIVGHLYRKSGSGMYSKLRQIVAFLQDQDYIYVGYAGGNILNLLVYLHVRKELVDLSGWDFSRLHIRQAYLQEAILRKVNFASASFSESVFRQAFGSVHAVAFSRDGLVAIGTTTGHIIIQHIDDSIPLLRWKPHKDWVRALAFSPDGRMLLSGGADNKVFLWRASLEDIQDSPHRDPQENLYITTFTEPEKWVCTVAFSFDGMLIASSGDDKIIQIWETETKKNIRQLFGHTDRVWSVAFSPCGKFLASGSEDKTIRVWDIEQGICVKQLEGHNDLVRSVAFKPNDGSLIASASRDQTVRLWNTITGDYIVLQEKEGVGRSHRGQVLTVAFSPDGALLVSGGDDHVARLWNTQTKKAQYVFSGHKARIWGVAFNPDGQTFVSGSEDQTVGLWYIQREKEKMLKSWGGYHNMVWTLAFSPDGETLVSGTETHMSQFWDPHNSPEEAFLGEIEAHLSRVRSVAFHPEGNILASSSEDHKIKLWKNVSDGREWQCFKELSDHMARVWFVLFSPDGKIFASGGEDCTVRLWNVNTWKPIHILQGHRDRLRSIVFSPDCCTVISGADDGMICVWDVASGEQLKVIEGIDTKGCIRSISLHPRGTLLASGGCDGVVRLWNTTTWECIQEFKGHTNQIEAVAFSPNGTLLVSGADDCTVRMWNIPKKHLLATLEGHESRIWAIAFSPDGTFFASGCEDETIKLWSAYEPGCLKTLRAPRPYESMNITNVKGLKEVEKLSLEALGAIGHSE